MGTRLTGAQGGDLLAWGLTGLLETRPWKQTLGQQHPGQHLAQPAVAAGSLCSEPQLCPQEGADCVRDGNPAITGAPAQSLA